MSTKRGKRTSISISLVTVYAIRSSLVARRSRLWKGNTMLVARYRATPLLADANSKDESAAAK